MASDPVDSSTEIKQDLVLKDGMQPTAFSTQIREDLVATAVKFLQNAKVQERPLEQRRAFLERKGMNTAEIELAMLRSGTLTTELDSASLMPQEQRGQPPFVGTPAIIPVATTVPSSWTRLRDVANMIVLLTGAAYAVYHVYKRLILPALRGGEDSDNSDPLKEVRRSVDELRRSMADVVAGITETQSLMRVQQRQLDDAIRSSSLLRGPDELDRMHVTEVKEELRSLKALLLNRKQFPSLPTTTPVIPAWQLQQNAADNSVEPDIAESRAETKPSTTVGMMEDSEDRTDTNPSLTAQAETSGETAENVHGAPENKQPQIVENGQSPHDATTADEDDSNRHLSNGLDSMIAHDSSYADFSASVTH